jgi:hypothetical protein
MEGSPAYAGMEGSPAYAGMEGSPAYAGMEGSPAYAGMEGSPAYAGMEGSPAYAGMEGSPAYAGMEGSPAYAGMEKPPTGGFSFRMRTDPSSGAGSANVGRCDRGGCAPGINHTRYGSTRSQLRPRNSGDIEATFESEARSESHASFDSEAPSMRNSVGPEANPLSKPVRSRRAVSMVSGDVQIRCLLRSVEH